MKTTPQAGRAERLSRQLRLVGLLVAACAALLIGGCASRVPLGTDGPGANPPPNLDRLPDAVPRVEPLRSGGPNKPYSVFGQRYVPVAEDEPLVELGLASWYGRKFHGKPTASGEPYDMYAMTAAHKTMPIPSYARVRNPANGREVIVRINDRGPFAEDRVIDLSYAAALRLGLLRGVAPVTVERLTHAQIRAGVGAPSVAVAGAGVGLVAGTANPAPAPVADTRPRPVPGAGAGSGSVTLTPVSVALAPVVTPLPATPSSASAHGAMPLDAPAPTRGWAESPGLVGWWLQLGAFKLRDGALRLQQRTLQQAQDLPTVAVFETAGLFKVQVGPYSTRDGALRVAARLRQQVGVEAVLLERAPPM